MKTLKTYECRIDNFHDDYNLISNHVATTASKARYIFWQDHRDYLASYGECIKHIKTRSLGAVKAGHLFGSAEMFERIAKMRGVSELSMGMKVDVSGKIGTLIGADSNCNFKALFADGTTGHLHPTWETTYYSEDGGIVYNFKK